MATLANLPYNVKSRCPVRIRMDFQHDVRFGTIVRPIRQGTTLGGQRQSAFPIMTRNKLGRRRTLQVSAGNTVRPEETAAQEGAWR